MIRNAAVASAHHTPLIVPTHPGFDPINSQPILHPPVQVIQHIPVVAPINHTSVVVPTHPTTVVVPAHHHPVTPKVIDHKTFN